MQPLAIALAGGVLPALLWLWFWLKEDSEHPEPRGLITLSFVAGMAVVFFVLPLQKLVVVLMPSIMQAIDFFALKFAFVAPINDTVQAILWSAVEEFGKFATVFLVAYHTKDFDEPIDAVIYMITAALGFVAMENSLYILKDLMHGGTLQLIIDSNLRFLGASIVHVVSSAVLGIAFAFTFYKSFPLKVIAGVIGLATATLLHAYFNLSIMSTYGTLNMLAVFAQFWIAIVGIIILITFIKHIENPNKKITL